MKLVIAEKPSVGAAIAAVMGANEKRSGYFEGGGYGKSRCRCGARCAAVRPARPAAGSVPVLPV